MLVDQSFARGASQIMTLSNKPDFIVAGCTKSGTTAVYTYLQQHPDIYMTAVKEPRYFAFAGKRPAYAGPGDHARFNATTVYSGAAYSSLFDGRREEKIAGEASPAYMDNAHPHVADNIYRENPDTKIIILIRNPVERAFSMYQHHVRDGYEPLDFVDALDCEDIRLSNNWAPHWGYRAMGRISDQLATYFEKFVSKQVRIILYDDFKKDNQAAMNRIFSFLDVGDFKIRQAYVNTPWVPKSKRIARFISRPNPVINTARKLFPTTVKIKIRESLLQKPSVKLKLPSETREELTDYFSEDILATARMTHMDLSHWLEHEWA